MTHFEVVELLPRPRAPPRSARDRADAPDPRPPGGDRLPVSGDPVYGVPGDLGLERQFLHAARLAFAHPFGGEAVEVESPLPADLAAALERARARRDWRNAARRPALAASNAPTRRRGPSSPRRAAGRRARGAAPGRRIRRGVAVPALTESSSGSRALQAVEEGCRPSPGPPRGEERRTRRRPGARRRRCRAPSGERAAKARRRRSPSWCPSGRSSP